MFVIDLASLSFEGGDKGGKSAKRKSGGKKTKGAKSAPKKAARKAARKAAGGGGGASVAAEAKHLHDNAHLPSTSFESIQGLRSKLGGLSKTAVAGVAHSIGMVGMASRSKSKIIHEIVGRIERIKQGHIRTNIAGRI